MKLTKKLEAEILKAYNDLWAAYLRGDMRTFASILDENCYIIGSAAGEVFSNKKAAVKYYKSTAVQITGKAEFRNRKIKVMPVEKGFMVNEEADFYLLIDDQWTYYGPGRISSLFHKKNNKWKVIHQHGSFPDSKTEEGEQVNTDKIKAENIQLRDAVKRRTEELENKNRELEIESALERVRARAMAMQSSDELIEVANVLRQQMVELGQSGFDTAAVHLYPEDSEYFDSWYSFRQGDPVTGKIVTGKTKFKKDECKMLREMVKAYHSKQNDYTLKASGEKLKEWFSLLKKTIPEIKINLDKNPGSNYIHFSDFSGGSLVIATFQPPTQDSMILQKRCATVFDLAYRRYVDLKKAEAQAREAEIELALERVRAKTMAMQKPSEFVDVVSVIGEQFVHLGFDIEWANFGANGLDVSNGIDIWNFAVIPGLYQAAERLYIPYIDHPVFTIAAAGLNKYQRTGKDFFVIDLDKKDKDRWMDHMYTKSVFKEMPDEFKTIQYNKSGYTSSVIVLKDSWLSIGKFDPKHFTEEQNAILRRFANAFGQAYTRFLDLQKAETQAREAQIELGLERVRVRAMTMHSSDELNDLVKTLFGELIHLDVKLATCLISTFDISTLDETSWMFHPITREPYVKRIPYNEQPFYHEMLRAWKERNAAWNYCLEGEAKVKWHDFLFADTEFALLPQSVRDEMQRPDKVFFTASYYSYGAIQAASLEPFPAQSIDIIQRFSKVFDLSYTRFLDLKKAEAQVREAQIETGLERVRSKTMAMHKSEEVTGIAVSLNEELLKLGFEGGSTIIIIDKETGDTEQWTGFSEDKTLKSCYVPYFKHPCHDAQLDALKRGEKFLVYTLTGEEKKTFDEHYFATGYKDFPESDKKWMRQMESVTFSYAFMKYGAIHWGPGHLTEEQLRILQRFSKVFEQSYTRFLDLQKAETQAREAKIEAALERVRSRSMAMHKSDDLHQVIKVVVEQFSVLSVKFNVSNFAKIDPDGSWDLWLSTPEQTYPALVHVPYIDHRIFSRITEEGKKGNDFFTDVYTREEANIFFHHFFENTIAKNTPEERKQFVYNSNGFARSIFLTKNIWFSVGRYDSISFTDEENAIFKRFANVFEQAYTRFLDLQKAEAQAREAEIELALERVRAKTMAMQKPSEFVDVINIIGEQFVQLGFDIEWVNFGANGFNISEGIDIWNFAVVQGASPISARVFIPYFDHPVFTTSAANINEFLNGGRDFIIVTLDKQTKDTWLDHLYTKTIFKEVPQELRKEQYDKPGYTTSNVSIKDTWLSIGKFDIKTFTDEQHAILRRFANAFGQAYTRFLDLQKAEAQAREAQIEAGLERVRSRAMGMQTSEELNVLIGTVFTELTKLDLVLTRCVIWILDKKTKAAKWWMANSEDASNPAGFFIKYHESHPYQSFLSEWEKQTVKWVYDLHGQVKKDWDDFLFSETELVNLPKFVQDGMRAPDRVLLSATFNNFGAINVASLEPLSDEHYDIMLRFAKVFDLTYTRFNDLKQAEAQAREARIETALERIRARTMAMQKSDELPETTFLLFQQLKGLGETAAQLSIGIIKEEEGYVELSATVHGNQLLQTYHVPKDEPYVMRKAVKAWNEKQRSLTLQIEGQELKDYNNWRNSVLEKKIDFPEDQWIVNLVFFSKGMLSFSSDRQIAKETLQLLERFAGVFDLTYTRFLDLKKAEAQTREAQIELALERVRARTMAMHKSEELAETAQVLFQQLLELGGIPDRISIGITDEKNGVVNFWSTDQLGSHIDKSFSARLNERTVITKTYKAWKEQQRSLIIDLQGDDLEEWIQFAREEMGIVVKDDQIKNRRVHTLVFFSHGWILVSTHEPQSAETVQILERFASVFNLTYRRFLDLEKAEAQTREAQIEAALEKVRGSALAMHNSNDISTTTTIVFTELRKLGIHSIRCGVGLLSKDSQMAQVYAATTSAHGDFYTLRRNIDMSEHSSLAQQYETWLKQENYVAILTGEELRSYYNLPLFQSSVSYVPPEHYDQKEYGYYIPFTEGLFYAWTDKPYSEDEQNILSRFKTIIDLTFRRYLDLEKAEAQAREAQIEAALEKVRSRSLAMHKSDELQEVVNTVFERLQDLDIEMDSANIAIFKEGVREYDYWIASNFQKRAASFHMPYIDLSLTKDVVAARERGEDFFCKAYSFEEKNEWFNYAFKNTDFKYLTEERKQFILAAKAISVAIAFSKNTGIQINRYSGNLPTEGEIDILKRFSKVFEQAYIRFLDLEKAEAQARDAQIEASLERVRSKTMAMHNSHDVGETVAVMFDELRKLDIETLRCGVGIMLENYQMELWTARPGATGKAEFIVGHIDMKLHPLLTGGYEAWKNRAEGFFYQLKDEDLKTYFDAINSHQAYAAKYDISSLPSLMFHYEFNFNEGCLFAFSIKQFSDESSQIFKRFTGVFGQTYRRYLDLQKAESQAREAQIEAALERVRSKAMAMHNSNDLSSAASVVFTELKKLGIKTIRSGISLQNKENRKNLLYTSTSTEAEDNLSLVGWALLDDHPVLKEIYDSWIRGEDYFPVLKGELLKSYYDKIKGSFVVPGEQAQDYEQHGYFIAFTQGMFYGWAEKPFDDNEKNILKRFASVVDLTFKRYFDLQKAESQAREAQIEASLERVRSKTMAMHSSDDVTSATATMFTELDRLGIENMRCGIAHYLEDHKMEVWSVSNLADGKVVRGAGLLDTNSIPFWKLFYSTWQKKEDFLYYYMAGKEKEEYFKKINAVQNYLSQSIEESPDLSIQTYYFREGSVWAFSLKPHSEEDKQVMKRFASVFSLTFRRYQDLKKAEAQAREATIEAALEKVRGKAMAMHNSNDLSVTTSMIIGELRKLGITPIRCGVGIISKETHKAQLYTATASADGDSLSVVGWVLLKGHPVLENIYEKWVEGEDYFPELIGDSLRSYYEQLLAGLSVPLPDFKDGQKHYGHFFSFSVGCLYTWSDVRYNDDEIKILRRFATIIDLTFRRYFELQKSETNAREAVKQAALDRIRADIASMRTIKDLDRITPLIWNELTVLGIPFIRCGVFIMDDDQDLIHTFLSTPDGKAIAAFHLPYDTPGSISKVIDGWRHKKIYLDHWGQEEFVQFADILMKQGALNSREQYLKTIPHGGFYLHFLPFLQGMLYVGNTTQLGDEEIELIQHVADAFSTAYARYEDFNKLEAAKQTVERTLTDLKQTQQQLVQSEKMASLGELTAGIAHEIQNPLNFVNNFSEVSKELLDEMKTELEIGNTEDAKEIADDVIQNLEKINHHGKRADAIVKSMLQHSRSSSGKKEPADINGLADEYLRLAYHGLRAKDKSFNAKFETELDNSIGKINIISQDIGRVLVNLINNAFYAVSERKKQESNGYEPTVTVHTKKIDDKIEIKVKDNGNGIPQKVLDKIFQPFFTTKPTGQGTGLGLSLAYDIITKGHGGELKVETKEGEGSEFIIQIPMN